MSKRGKMRAEALADLSRRGGPLSAYDVLGELREANPKIAPPTIYRAPSTLAERGRAYRLEAFNAFIASQCALRRNRTEGVLQQCGKGELTRKDAVDGGQVGCIPQPYAALAPAAPEQVITL